MEARQAAEATTPSRKARATAAGLEFSPRWFTVFKPLLHDVVHCVTWISGIEIEIASGDTVMVFPVRGVLAHYDIIRIEVALKVATEEPLSENLAAESVAMAGLCVCWATSLLESTNDLLDTLAIRALGVCSGLGSLDNDKSVITPPLRRRARASAPVAGLACGSRGVA